MGKFSLLAAAAILAGCSTLPQPYLDLNAEAAKLPATKTPNGNCQDHTNAVLRAMEGKYEVAVLKNCSTWFKGGCHVSALVNIDGVWYVFDNGALGFKNEIPTLEEVRDAWQTQFVQILPPTYITDRFDNQP